MPELWTNSVGWFNLCKIRQSPLTGISGLGNMKVCSKLYIFYHCLNKSDLLVLGQVYPGKYRYTLTSVQRAVSCLLNINYLQGLKFDIVYDNGVSLQPIVVYMKFPKESLLWIGENGPFYPNFAPAAALLACMFLKFCIQGSYNKKQTNEMRNIWNFLYCTPNLFKLSRLGQNAPSIFRVQQASGKMIVFKYIFFIRFNIKLCIWKSNRLFSIG